MQIRQYSLANAPTLRQTQIKAESSSEVLMNLRISLFLLNISSEFLYIFPVKFSDHFELNPQSPVLIVIVQRILDVLPFCDTGVHDADAF